MAKMKITIDSDIDYVIFTAEARALGYSAEARVKLKRTARSGAVSALSAPDVIDQPSQVQHEEIHDEPEFDGNDE